MTSPLVSIIIPVFNGSKYLSEAIDSALAQTYPNIEVIVVNDGSKDQGKTREIALSYGARITYLEKENGGVATALNEGIRASRGRYISWLSHDDAYEPNKVEVDVQFMEKLETEGRKMVIYSSYVIMDENSVVYRKIEMPEIPPEKFFEALLGNMIFQTAFKRVPFSIHGCTLLIPRALFDEVGFFNEALRTTQDYDLWFKAIEKYDFVGIREYLVRSRVHKGQSSYVMRKERIEEVEDLYLGAFNLYRSGSSRYALDLPRSMLALRLKNRQKAYRAARILLKKEGFSMRSLSYTIRAILAPPLVFKGKAAFGKLLFRIQKIGK